jgi:hypothetical protein
MEKVSISINLIYSCSPSFIGFVSKVLMLKSSLNMYLVIVLQGIRFWLVGNVSGYENSFSLPSFSVCLVVLFDIRELEIENIRDDF